MKRLLKAMANVAKAVLLILPIILIVYVLWTRVNEKMPFLFGYSTSVVTTGSMSDVLPVGCIILSREYRGEDLEKGQIITYLGEEGSFKGIYVTHEIIAVETDETTGERIYTTKGTMNSEQDPPVRGDMVKSVFILRVVNLGWLFEIVERPGGFFAVLIVPVLVLIVYEAWELFCIMGKKEQNEENEKQEDEHSDK